MGQLLMDLLVPGTIFIIGLLLKYNPPKEINKLFGYMTTKARRSQASWDYAQKRMGETSTVMGSILIIMASIGNLLKPSDELNITLGYLGISLFGYFLCIAMVEHDLSKFNRRE